ncbi:hypothetical protein EZS27_008704 [termite gut metagenome]|uniref:Uncharacterized protein n=1 Tax=termite gut metagenome TaxID=433724 RepID=A0A5J4SCZ3_9ZZZZ
MDKESLRSKRLKAGWNKGYLIELLLLLSENYMAYVALIKQFKYGIRFFKV